MGQYWSGLILTPSRREVLVNPASAHVYDEGVKLMEHAWLDSDYLAHFEALLTIDGPSRVVWLGDYCDNELDELGNETNRNLYQEAAAKRVTRTLVAGRTYEEVGATDILVTVPALPTLETHPYLLNHDRKEWVDKTKVPEGWENMRIHPLPILTAEGNGRGGGDLREDRSTGDFRHLVGRWARDSISSGDSIPTGWTEIAFDLAER